MKKKTFALAMIVAVALVMAAGGLFASNMGFKLNYQLLSASNPGSAAGDNTIGLPYNKQSGIVNASDLRNDIGAASVNSISMFDPTTGGFPLPYTGRKGSGPDFALNSGEAYFINMLSDVNYIIVGSHDPSLAVALNATGSGGSVAGDNFFAPPYHTTCADASDLRNDIGAASVNSISQFDKATGGYPLPYTGRKGSGPNFTLTPGEGYFINMLSTVSYTPSHY